MAEPILRIDQLRVDIPVEDRLRTVLHDVSMSLSEGEALGLVGESGAGKSMTARAVVRLLPEGSVVRGSITFAGKDVCQLSRDALRDFYARDIGVIFQDPRVHVNPVRTIGDFLREAMVTNLGFSVGDANVRALELLSQVGIADGRRRLRQYPHQLSGGLLQRVMIAAALAPSPRLLIADEPTTALDVTTQADVIAILDEQRRERGMALIFITHDLDLASAVCDRTAVMYAGSICEEQASAKLNEDPRHPYTAALMRSRPRLEERGLMKVVPGRPVSAFERPPGCPFAPRCPYAAEQCRTETPSLLSFPGGRVACLLADELQASNNLDPLRHVR